MQDTRIGTNCSLKYVITDKDVLIKDGRTLMGFQSYPYISVKRLWFKGGNEFEGFILHQRGPSVCGVRRIR